MGHVIQLPTTSRPRGDIPAAGAQLLLFTGVWRERYETTPTEICRAKGWNAAKSCGVKTPKTTASKIAGRDAPKGPTAPTRGKKRA